MDLDRLLVSRRTEMLTKFSILLSSSGFQTEQSVAVERDSVPSLCLEFSSPRLKGRLFTMFGGGWHLGFICRKMSKPLTWISM